MPSTIDRTTATYRKTARRRREVAQILQQLPADDRLREPHPVPRSTQLTLEVRELQASVSPTPFVVDPGAALGGRVAILRFANLHPALPGGREVFDRLGAYCSEVTSSSSRRPCACQAPSSSRRSSPSLPSSPYCPPGQSLVAVSHQHLRESQA